ncbi:asparagine synthase (glutamine-hydrolyzing) [Pseudoxanthomonas composti]|uniref:asparagine synthase (glutamine-hydrolyzing) n=1 Tax=Pseudoxanthomonas composti TaxID=2137479 RepID=A0A4Q1JRM6_9GAMM|nr:asparagine synthase (glutamine-hydrolyzing) [Pseudoxanthomonas composti]RXR00884.1 asparagine synthase (glutamine-hydrolyzing) [Pseudoxanthomonas composti]
MCGIAGLVVAPGQPAPSLALGQRMTEVIAHRGPDDTGIHHDQRALLGMRRLAIIDVAGSHQPLYGADRRVALVFNGEIYNYRELRRELEAAGHVFHTQGDTEVILQAYLRWGADAFTRLDGMFGVAIWDTRSGELLLARDRLGEKPLYYTANAQRILFGSELKSLLQSPDCPREIDPDALRAYLTYGYVPCPRSIFRDVHKLPPGHLLRVCNGQVSLHRYWQPSMGPKLQLSQTEAAEQLETLLDQAVSSRLVADVPFGAFLSGGLDSSTVVALMARRMQRPVKTFTIGFSEDAYNELDDARRVARHLGTEHHELVVQPDAVGLLDKLVFHFDEPFADASAVPTYLVSELAAQHVKMVLTGDGGDELFGGYDRYLKLMTLERSGALRKPAALALSMAGAIVPDPLGKRLGRIGERMRLPFAQRYLSGVALTRPDTASALRAGAGGAQHYDLPLLHQAGSDLGAGDSVLDRAVAIDLQSYLPDDILVKLDRMAMAASLEGRSPFLATSLVEFALRLPESLRVRDGRGKHLLREVAAPWLPPRAISKPKQGFGVPLPAWFRGPLRALAADTFASRSFRERGLIDPAAADGLLAEHLSGAVDHSEPLWQVLCLERWARTFLDAPAGAA